MLKLYCGLGDILGKMSPKRRGNFNIQKKTLKTGEMLKLSRFLGLLGPLGSIDPENKDNFDNFNVSPVLSVFFRMLKFYCGLGDIFPKKCRRNSGETLTFEKKRVKQGKC